MELKDIKPNQGNIDVVVTVIRKDSPRTFEKFGKKGKVCNVVVKDGTGQVTLTLWNDDIDLVNEGDTIHVQNGWCSEYRNEKQLSTGKFGKIEVIKGAVDRNTVFTNDPAMLAGGAPDQEENDEDAEEPEEASEEEFIE
ncbi:MAG: replication factor A1 [archaeon GW2011_AR9]|nr:MAG: replication factor A1 [archaeon GW2011_AR9]MBS3120582.1 hypothetical protein [Candidatus Woesearchaeota archaeon]HIG93660.1 hypothetical protein [Candidatus Woesearchaeota archaeon]HIH12508.1 hypothetical protein [Candidatus Woesearchaeota archaeon]